LGLSIGYAVSVALSMVAPGPPLIEWNVTHGRKLYRI
jgi:hypothetical protein